MSWRDGQEPGRVPADMGSTTSPVQASQSHTKCQSWGLVPLKCMMDTITAPQRNRALTSADSPPGARRAWAALQKKSASKIRLKSMILAFLSQPYPGLQPQLSQQVCASPSFPLSGSDGRYMRARWFKHTAQRTWLSFSPTVLMQLRHRWVKAKQGRLIYSLPKPTETGLVRAQQQ